MPPPAENRTLDLITVSPVKNLLKCGSLVGFGQTELAPHFTSTLMPRLCGLQGIDPHELEASARCHIYDIKEGYLDNLVAKITSPQPHTVPYVSSGPRLLNYSTVQLYG